MKTGEIYISTSGWSNANWKGILYPPKMASKDFLAFYAGTFNASEINTTFYHIPKLKTVENWVDRVPKGFKFCPKVSQYLTHMKKLRDPEEPLSRFITAIEPAKKMLGPVLLQLPPSLKFDPDIAEHLFELLQNEYNGYQFALEPRHDTWFTTMSIDLLSKYNIAFVISESGGRFPYGEFVTSGNVYIRFHGAEKLYDSSYSDQALNEYADKIKKWQHNGHDIWVFFNNTMHGSALNNANKLKEILQEDNRPK